MTRSLWFFLKVGLLVALAVWLVQRPGTVTIDWQGWLIEMRVAVLAALLLGIAVLSALGYRLWLALRGGPGAFGRRRRASRRDKGYRALTQGMVAVAAGDAEAAQRYARQAEGLLNEPPLTLLLSAQAAQLQGDDQAARKYFQAMLKRRETEFLGLRGLLTQALKRGDRVEALDHARRAQQLQPKAEWPAVALVELEAASGHWIEAEAALDRAQRAKAIPADLARHRRAVLLVEESCQDAAEGRMEEALQGAQKAHDLNPASVPAAVQLATLRARTGNVKAAGKVLEQAWRAGAHPDLARAWGAVAGLDDPLALVKRQEELLRLGPDCAEAHLALGEAALKARLWGVSRMHLEKARTLAPTARVHRLLADLAQAEQGDGPAYRDALARLAAAAPDPAWVCRSCGSTAPGWSAVCRHCGGFDTLDWTVPGALPRLGAGSDDGPTALVSPTSHPRPADRHPPGPPTPADQRLAPLP